MPVDDGKSLRNFKTTMKCPDLHLRVARGPLLPAAYLEEVALEEIPQALRDNRVNIGLFVVEGRNAPQ